MKNDYDVEVLDKTNDPGYWFPSWVGTYLHEQRSSAENLVVIAKTPGEGTVDDCEHAYFILPSSASLVSRIYDTYESILTLWASYRVYPKRSRVCCLVSSPSFASQFELIGALTLPFGGGPDHSPASFTWQVDLKGLQTPIDASMYRFDELNKVALYDATQTPQSVYDFDVYSEIYPNVRHNQCLYTNASSSLETMPIFVTDTENSIMYGTINFGSANPSSGRLHFLNVIVGGPEWHTYSDKSKKQ